MVKSAIDAGLAQKQVRNEITADYVVGELHDVAKMAKQSFENNPTNPSMANSAIKGFELLGKYLGIFIDRHEVNSTVKIEGTPFSSIFEK